ncbi:sialin-like isoform X2 [Lytechinus pictus]
MHCTCSARWLFAVLAFVGISTVHVLRLNLSVVMVTIAKTNHSAHLQSHDINASTQTCSRAEVKGMYSSSKSADLNQTEFEWSSNTQGLLLASFYIGYAVMNGPVGWLADSFGGKWLFAGGVTISAIMNIAAPIIIRTSLPLFFVTRVVSGMAEAVTFPSSNTLTTKWAPEKEKTRMTSLIVGGSSFGSAVGQFFSGMVCSFVGWEATFYIFGCSCLVWVLLWALLVYEEPGDHPFISDEERKKIENNRSRRSVSKVKEATPFCSMMTSMPAIAWFVTMVTIAGFVVFILLTDLPLYMKHVQGLDVAEIGFLLPIPFVAHCVMMMVFSSLSDMLVKRKYLGVTQTRKLVVNIGAVISSGSLLAASHIGCSHFGSVALMTTAMGGVGISFAGIFVNAQDLAPRFAGTLFGIGNAFSVSTGFVGPVIVGLMTEDQSDPEGWRTVFYLTAGLSLFGAIFFQLFGSGLEQEWAKGKTIYSSLEQPTSGQPSKETSFQGSIA